MSTWPTYTYPSQVRSEADKASYYALKMAQSDLPPHASVQRDIVRALTLLEHGEATAQELVPYLGLNWVLARNTPDNRARYGRCVAPKDYKEAKRRALNDRVDRLWAEYIDQHRKAQAA